MSTERYILNRINDKEWCVIDKETGASVVFEQNKYNETQNFISGTKLREQTKNMGGIEAAMYIARIAQMIGYWLANNHRDII